MNEVSIESIINQRPRFSSPPEPPKTSLLKENSLLHKLRPSQQSTTGLFLLIKHLFNKAMSYLFPISKTFYTTILGALDRYSPLQQMHLNNLPPHELVDVFQKFLKTESTTTPQFKKCIENLSEQYKQFHSFSRYSDAKLRFKEQSNALKNKIASIGNLKKGEMELIAASDDPKNHLFYLFSKEESGMTLKIFGNGSSMVELSGIEAVYAAGKVKIPSAITYTNVPENLIKDNYWLKALLGDSYFHNKFQAKEIANLTTHLKEYQQSFDKTDRLSKKTDNFAKTLLSAIKQANTPNKTVNRRLHLKLELNTLFQVYKEHRYYLCQGTEEFNALEAGHRRLSEEALLAYKKGYLSKEDLNDIVKELKVIKNCLIEAKNPIRNSSILNFFNNYPKGLKKFEGVRSPCSAKYIEPNKETDFEPRSPISFENATILPSTELGDPFFERIKDYATAKTKLDALVNVPNANKIVEVVNKLEFFPYYRIGPTGTHSGLTPQDYAINPNSWMNKLSDEEALALLKSLSFLSEWLTTDIKKRKESTIDELEILLKLACIKNFLGNRFVTINHYPLRITLIDFYHLPTKNKKEVESPWVDQYVKNGHRLHSSNSLSYLEITQFCDAFSPNLNPSMQNQSKIQNLVDPHFEDLFNRKNRGAYFLPERMKKWLRPFSHPFLMALYRQVTNWIGEHRKCVAVYNAKSEEEENSVKIEWDKKFYRKDGMKTQEAIMDDPELTADFFLEEINEVITHQLTFNFADKREAILNDIPRQFTLEEMQSLLLLVRNNYVQTEIAALMEKSPTLFFQPEVFNFVEAIFFNRSLLPTLYDKKVFREEFPTFLSKKIDELFLSISNKPANTESFIRLIDFNHKLMNIYQQNGYPIDKFSKIGQELIDYLLEKESPYKHSLITSDLKFSLESAKLDHLQTTRILINYTQYKTTNGNPLNFDPQISNFIEFKYSELLKSLKEQKLAVSDYQYVLDTLCSKKNLPLDHSEWEGSFPQFQNGQYRINLEKGTIEEIKKQYSHSKLPERVLEHPIFQSYFKHLNLENLEIQKQTKGSITAYFFKDSHGIIGRVEDNAGHYSFYKTFQGKEYQAVSLEKFIPKEKNPLTSIIEKFKDQKIDIYEKIQMFFGIIKNDILTPTSFLPLIFEKGVYLDPKNPFKGYSFNEKGELLFEIYFDNYMGEINVQKVFDCRKGEKTGSWNVYAGSDLNETAVKKLSGLEHPSQILKWEKGKTEKIELARYGLSFELDLNSKEWFCTDPKYKGYFLDLQATLEDKKGLEFAIILKHSDRTLPKKLLFPEASRITLQHESFNQFYGLPKLFWKIKIFLEFAFRKLLPNVHLKSFYAIDPWQPSDKYYSLDLRPHTNEVICSKEQKIELFLQMADQALATQKYELAYQYLLEMDLKAEDLSKENNKLIRQFVKGKENQTGPEAAVKLKLIQKFKLLCQDHHRYHKLATKFDSEIIKHTKAYLNHGRKLADHLHPTSEEMMSYGQLIQKMEPIYFKLHVFPYFLNKEKSFSLPLQAKKEFIKPIKTQLEKSEIKQITLEYKIKQYVRNIHNLNEDVDIDFSQIEIKSDFIFLYNMMLKLKVFDSNFNLIKWNIRKMIPRNGKIHSTEELLADILNTMIILKEKNIEFSTFPNSPELKVTETDDVRVTKFSEFLDSLNAVIKVIKDELPKNEDKPLFKVVLPYNQPTELPTTHIKFQALKKISIEELENEIRPDKPLEMDAFKHSFSYLDKGPHLLFTEKELSTLFKKEKMTLPDFQLPETNDEYESCEKESIETLKEHLEAYKKVKNEHFTYELSSSASTLNKWLKNILKPKLALLTEEKKKAWKVVQDMIHHSDDPVEQAAIYSQSKLIATDTEIMLALLQNDLEGLKKKNLLPCDINCEKLKTALGHFYETEVKLHLASICEEKFIHMIKKKKTMDPEMWKSESGSLFQLLSRTQRFSSQENPELVLFQAFTFITFRSLDNNKHQLELLLNMLDSPTGITQAVTGSGKTMLLSVLRSLMKPKGNNLVTQKVLPALYKQTIEIMQKILGDTFKTKIYPLRFDCKTRLVEHEKIKVNRLKLVTKQLAQTNFFLKMVQFVSNFIGIPQTTNELVEEELFETKPISIFKKMYQQMLETIKEKGCIITDYKSFPLLEEKFWKLDREFLAMKREGISPSDIEVEHWTYLRKILILQKNVEDQMMDEFDQPNKPIHRIQIQMDKAKKPAQFLIDEALNIAELLREEKDLLLEDNLQAEISAELRQSCLENVAKKVAARLAKEEANEEEILDYLMGRDESVLTKLDDWTLRECDILSYCKDLFCIYFPLTLSYSRNGRYIRNGIRTEPAFNGEKMNAKFGNMAEEIIYTIQDYFQAGINQAELQTWINNLQKEVEIGHESAKERFKYIFPDKSLEDEHSLSDLVNYVNEDHDKILYFLKLRLDTLTASGRVISMDPQNIVSMAKTVSGVSATLGCKDAYHKQFHIDKEAAGHIQSEMLYRLVKRLNGHRDLLEYDPQNPETVIALAQTKKDICAIIDGSGAYKEYESQEIAQALKNANTKLEKVGYYNEEGGIEYIGNPQSHLLSKGFYYPKARTRGADIQLRGDGCAILTVNDKGTLEDLSQEEGRMRLDGQKVIIARSKFAPHIKDIESLIQIKAAYEGKKQSDDLFRAKKQALHNILRTHAKADLLEIENLDDHLNQFEKVEDIIITNPSPTFEEEGSYFKANKHHRKCDVKPLEVLEQLRDKLILKCQELKFKRAEEELNEMTYSEKELKLMPSYVYGLKDNIETELEVELEEELELEQEEEMEEEEETENELEVVNKVSRHATFYLPRLDSDVTYSVQEKINSVYNSKLLFTEPFLPLTRTDPMHKRKAFDDLMYRVGTVFVEITKVNDQVQIKNVVIGDILDDTINIKDRDGFFYDTRTNKVHQKFEGKNHTFTIDPALLESTEFTKLISQVKFFDGRIEDYTEKEFDKLKVWIKEQGLKKMKDHFENEVLRYRTETKERYLHSQVWKIFNESGVAV